MDSELVRLEETGMNSWPSENRLLYDGWVLNISSGWSNRANSVVPLYKSQLPLDEKIGYCEKLFRRSKLTPVFRVFENEDCDQLEQFLKNRSYDNDLRISVQSLDLDRKYSTSADIIECSTTEDEWGSWFGKFYGKSDEETKGYYRIVKQIVLPVFPVLKMYKGRTAGCGLGVLDGKNLGLFDIAVADELRGKGVGTAITESILQWGRGMGAERAWLQMEVSNSAASHIYSKLGFAEIYRYKYMRSRV